MILSTTAGRVGAAAARLLARRATAIPAVDGPITNQHKESS
jgi:hypothetical protein